MTEKEKGYRHLLMRVTALANAHLPMMTQAGTLIVEACITGMSELERNPPSRYEALFAEWEEDDKQALKTQPKIELHTNGASIPYMDGVTRHEEDGTLHCDLTARFKGRIT